MRGKQFFSTSKFFRTNDIPPAGLALTIRDCAAEVVGREQREVPVLHFKEDPRGLVLNRTNWATLARSYADESQEWINRSIVLEVVDVTFQGKVVPGIRVRVPELSGDGADDAIPF